MDMPSLPTDSLYKFLCFAGLALFIYSIHIRNEYTTQIVNKYDSAVMLVGRNNKMVLKNRERFRDLVIDPKDKRFVEEHKLWIRANALDSILTEEKKHLPSHVADSITKIEKELYQNFQYLWDQSDSIKNDTDVRTERLENSSWPYEPLMYFAYAVFAMGFVPWLFYQRMQDRILKAQYEKSKGSDTPCQSCGMLLKYDSKYKEGDVYCQTCYNGKTFREPDLTLDDMKHRVARRLDEIGVHRLYKKAQLKQLQKLDRWRKYFKW